MCRGKLEDTRDGLHCTRRASIFSNRTPPPGGYVLTGYSHNSTDAYNGWFADLPTGITSQRPADHRESKSEYSCHWL
jgi:hypothetical protein